MLFNAILLIIVLFLLLVLSMVWPPDSPWAPWWRTNTKTAKAFLKLAKVKKDDIIYELGSGDGMTLITAAKAYGAKCVGIEIDPLRAWLGKLLVKFYGVEDKVTIIQKNFFDVDISRATVVYTYLVPKALEKLKPMLQKQLSPKTRLVSLIYEIQLPLIKEDKTNKLRLYILQ